ncbi:response regulator receiver protein [Solidesulfovibrio carbinoliphilus subsp. oakridgensis]|uniref:Response regulator receiver protein n=1 Tax=Solidesulfovibrio carbinoliphilus subsp. oakridgensis TaxID=694327 RepID=G7QAA1_9BACT|nr:response regulator [Solidesulfovibrio carbinoliphilus]EHJ48252.1 response regulator receiver protein [Solidesulfovibrio carbinoliphilus subsp. oakridgensis]
MEIVEGRLEATARRRVLIVEDDPLSARVAAKILDRLGYSVCAEIETGEEAVSEAAVLLPDVVLMDINLAGAMDGVAAARVIIEGLGVPVIFLTAAVDREIMDRVAATGAAGYIQKPVKLLDLKANLEMAITRRHRERPCPVDPAALPRPLLDAVARALGRAFAVVSPDGRVLFAYPESGLAGELFADAFPGQSAAQAPGDTPCLDVSGRSFGFVRLLPE